MTDAKQDKAQCLFRCKRNLPIPVRVGAFVLLLVLIRAPAWAQDVKMDEGQAPQKTGTDRRNQRVERIVVEDAGSRVQELRVGGQTRSITVQPKSATGGTPPAYEVHSRDGARARPGNLGESDTVTAPRVWNLRKF